MDLPDDVKNALEVWTIRRLGMTVDELLLAFATLNGAQNINDVEPRALLYWSAFFMELARLQAITISGLRQLLAYKKRTP